MPLNAARLARDLERIAQATDSPGAGAGRPTFSPSWSEAVDYVVGEARACGCQVRVTAAGNIHLRPATLDPQQPVWLSGSHLDSVPHGGDYDGIVGVLTPLEVLRAAREDGATPPLELVIFAEEEGTTFGLGMLGSRAWAGTLAAARLATLRNAAGQSYLEAGAAYGVRPDHFDAERLRPADYLGLVEVHIEQGPGMWKRGQRVALVTAIAGRRQYQAELQGAANHAGSTSMADRSDALAGAAEMIGAIETFAAQLDPRAVATVGRIACQPNAVNVISGETSLTIDFRAPDDKLLARGDAELRARLTAIAQRRQLRFDLQSVEALPATALSPAVCDRLQQAATQLGHPLPLTVSGALHDAAIIAPLLPTAMLFVASRDGISHNPAEFSRVEDVALAARILYAMTGAGGGAM
ncbi:MAG: Zn-dependent hydrolase [Pirellulales bacterium]